jgi:hypothetical protein
MSANKKNLYCYTFATKKTLGAIALEVNKN